MSVPSKPTIKLNMWFEPDFILANAQPWMSGYIALILMHTKCVFICSTSNIAECSGIIRRSTLDVRRARRRSVTTGGHCGDDNLACNWSQARATVANYGAAIAGVPPSSRKPTVPSAAGRTAARAGVEKWAAKVYYRGEAAVWRRLSISGSQPATPPAVVYSPSGHALLYTNAPSSRYVLRFNTRCEMENLIRRHMVNSR